MDNVHLMLTSNVNIYSGVPIILEWEGSICRRRRGEGVEWGVRGGIPIRTAPNALPPPQKIFRIFC